MKKRFPSFLLIAASVSVLSCHAQQGKTGDNLDSFINKKADSLYRNKKVPGIFIGVCNNGVRKYYNFGYADPGKQMAFDSATIFEIGSITKTFTAYVLESILKERSISDTSLIIKYLPDSVRENTALADISFLNLLNHTSGLPRLPDNIDLTSKQPYENYDEKKLFSYLRHCQPKAPGQYEYSNLGFGLAGTLATILSGKTYSSLVNEYVFKPGKIRANDAGDLKQSRGFLEDEPVDYWKFDALSGAGALACSAREMLSYFQFISSASNGQSKKLIDKLLEPTYHLSPTTSVCRAWHTTEDQNEPVIYWHNGGTYGFSTFGAFIRGKNKAVIVVVNQFNKNTISDALGIAIIKRMMR